MQRRKAITAAAAVSLTLVAGATGIALSSGIVGSQTNDGVGQLSPISLTEPAVAPVHEPTTITVPAPTIAPAIRPTTSIPTTTSAASAHVSDDDHDEDEDDHDEFEDDHDEDEDDHDEDGGHEYEGADDDD